MLLAKFAWKPLLAFLASREEAIKTSLENAQTAKKELERLQQESAQIIRKAHGEAESIVSKSWSDAEKVREEMKQKAKSEADAIVKESQRQIETGDGPRPPADPERGCGSVHCHSFQGYPAQRFQRRQQPADSKTPSSRSIPAGVTRKSGTQSRRLRGTERSEIRRSNLESVPSDSVCAPLLFYRRACRAAARRPLQQLPRQNPQIQCAGCCNQKSERLERASGAHPRSLRRVRACTSAR